MATKKKSAKTKTDGRSAAGRMRAQVAREAEAVARIATLTANVRETVRDELALEVISLVELGELESRVALALLRKLAMVGGGK